jgi:hypothetical protein
VNISTIRSNWVTGREEYSISLPDTGAEPRAIAGTTEVRRMLRSSIETKNFFMDLPFQIFRRIAV